MPHTPDRLKTPNLFLNSIIGSPKPPPKFSFDNLTSNPFGNLFGNKKKDPYAGLKDDVGSFFSNASNAASKITNTAKDLYKNRNVAKPYEKPGKGQYFNKQYNPFDLIDKNFSLGNARLK